jgi:L-threonylcarbamoyladenylate synthase
MTRVLRIDRETPEPDLIAEAAAVLQRGGIVAFPTETVYGLGANALDEAAVARIFIAKGRPPTDPVIVHLAAPGDLSRVAIRIPADAWKLAETFWPGALTLILHKSAAVPENVTAGLQTVAVRVPSHAIAHALIAAAGVPVAAPSANRFSRPSPTCADHVRADLGGRIDLIVDGGPTPIGVESTIVDLTATPAVIRRPGGVSLEQIRQIVPTVLTVSAVMPDGQPQPSPGQLLRHYAPRARMTVYVGDVEATAARVGHDVGTVVAGGGRVGVLAPEEDLVALAPRLAAAAATGRVVTRRCGSRADRDEAARDLFRVLRELDAAAVDVIFATAPDGDGINAAILDRLTRASEGRVHRVIE